MDRGTVKFSFQFDDGEVSMTLRRSEKETTDEFIKRVKIGSEAIDALIEKGTKESPYSWEFPFLQKPAPPVPKVEEEVEAGFDQGKAIQSDALNAFEDL